MKDLMEEKMAQLESKIIQLEAKDKQTLNFPDPPKIGQMPFSGFYLRKKSFKRKIETI